MWLPESVVVQDLYLEKTPVVLGKDLHREKITTNTGTEIANTNNPIAIIKLH